MKICFCCDLHLPFDRNALQYDVLEWAVGRIKKKTPDCVVFAGDATCDGNMEVYRFFVKRLKETSVPFIYIPGNSDLRNQESREEIRTLSSDCINVIGQYVIYAVNDSDANVSDSDLNCLSGADENSVVFMHHPPEEHKRNRERLLEWRRKHAATPVFFGHLHRSFHIGDSTGGSFALQAMDPDKAIGECPCISYYDTETKKIEKDYFSCPVPEDIYDRFGFSCFSVEEQIALAVDKGIKYLELRPKCLDSDVNVLKELIKKWRSACGEELSLHLPDISYKNGGVVADERIDEYFELAETLKVGRFTQHVPKISVRTVKEDPGSIDRICAFLAGRINALKTPVTVGIENMHMTKNDTPDDGRRFGYIPEECLLFMQALASKCIYKVGVNFDFGHARNNAPFSKKYQISTWLSMLGKYAVGYHVHQVTNNGKFENHMAITDVYGELISYASFFRYWSENKVQKAPLIFEMRPKDAYETTLQCFEKYRKKPEN